MTVVHVDVDEPTDDSSVEYTIRTTYYKNATTTIIILLYSKHTVLIRQRRCDGVGGGGHGARIEAEITATVAPARIPGNDDV